MMTVRTLLIAGALTFLALLGIAFGTTMLVVGDGSGGAREVGLTNRQGMMSQKIAKEALAYARNPSPEGLAQLRDSMQVFSVTQRALRFGGAAPLDLEGERFADVVGATDPSLQKLLREASSHWDTIADAVERLIVAAQRRNEALALVELKNPRLMRKMDEVTRLLEGRKRSAALRVAGRQGVIAERAVKEALLYDAAPDAARRDQLLASISAFERGHDVLRNGRPLRGSSGSRRPTNTVADKLDEAKWLWIDQAEALTRLISEEAGYHRSVRTITETNPLLLETLSAAAVQADAVAEAGLRRLQSVQVVVLALGLIAAIAAVFLAVRVGSALRDLRNVAESISRGNVDTPVVTVGPGELHDLARSFERMRLSLQKAMELLERPSASQRGTVSTRSTHDRL